jgi:hypothetical protein
VGAVLVAAVGLIVAVAGWGWLWFAIANAGLAVLLVVLFRGSVSGEDERRPPGPARVSAARWAGPVDPDRLGLAERSLEPDHGAAQETRDDDLRTAFAFLWSALPPAAASALTIVFLL